MKQGATFQNEITQPLIEFPCLTKLLQEHLPGAEPSGAAIDREDLLLQLSHEIRQDRLSLKLRLSLRGFFEEGKCRLGTC